MYKIDKQTFNKNLLVTQAYCEKQLAENKDVHVAGILRSFNPEINGKPLFSYKRYIDFTVEWSEDPLSGVSTLYAELFNDQLENKYQLISDVNAEKIYSGEILIAEIDEVICDGVSESESDGFIDGNDCPPVDTWFYMTSNNKNRMLFAWIPEQFVGLVNEAILVTALNVLSWYNEKSPWLDKEITGVSLVEIDAELNALHKRNLIRHEYASNYELPPRGNIWARLKQMFGFN